MARVASPRTLARRHLEEIRRLVFSLETLADVAAFEAAVCDDGLLGGLTESQRDEVRRLYGAAKRAIVRAHDDVELLRAIVGPRAA